MHANKNENFDESKQGYERLLIQCSFTKYAFKMNKHDRVIIIAPHPDDETLGCGGIITKFSSNNIQTKILLLTDGNGERPKKQLPKERKKEFNNALSIYKNTKHQCLDFPDGKLDKHYKQLLNLLSKYILEFKPNFIFVPYVLDYSLDHKICNYVLADMLKKHNLQEIFIAMYEIWTPILYPNYYINITNEFETKKNAINCYDSQEKYYHLLNKAKALNALRAELSMRKAVKYVECFKGYNSINYQNIIRFYKKNYLKGAINDVSE